MGPTGTSTELWISSPRATWPPTGDKTSPNIHVPVGHLASHMTTAGRRGGVLQLARVWGESQGQVGTHGLKLTCEFLVAAGKCQLLTLVTPSLVFQDTCSVFSELSKTTEDKEKLNHLPPVHHCGKGRPRREKIWDRHPMPERIITDSLEPLWRKVGYTDSISQTKNSELTTAASGWEQKKALPKVWAVINRNSTPD